MQCWFNDYHMDLEFGLLFYGEACAIDLRRSKAWKLKSVNVLSFSIQCCLSVFIQEISNLS